MKKNAVPQAFDSSNMPLSQLYGLSLWRWVDEVVAELLPRKVTVVSLCAVIYDEKTRKTNRKIKRLKRGDYIGWESFQDQVKYVKSVGNGGSCHVDFDLILAEETAASTTRIAPPPTPRVSNVTATILQEEGIAGYVAAEQAGGGWAVAIRDKWRCEDTCCRNYRYTY